MSEFVDTIWTDQYIGPTGIGFWHDNAIDDPSVWEVGARILVVDTPAEIISHDKDGYWYFRLEDV